MGRSVAFGATLPGSGYAMSTVVLGEAATTFALVATLCVFLGFRHLRQYTPFAMPWLYAVMVPLEAHISGTSTNPARTFGPALISGRWDGWWIYWVGPMMGTLAAILVFSSNRQAHRSREALSLRERSPAAVSPDERHLDSAVRGSGHRSESWIESRGNGAEPSTRCSLRSLPRAEQIVHRLAAPVQSAPAH